MNCSGVQRFPDLTENKLLWLLRDQFAWTEGLLVVLGLYDLMENELLGRTVDPRSHAGRAALPPVWSVRLLAARGLYNLGDEPLSSRCKGLLVAQRMVGGRLLAVLRLYDLMKEKLLPPLRQLRAWADAATRCAGALRSLRE